MPDPNATFAADLAGASAALRAFADGPARDAAEQLSASFEGAGSRIEEAMNRAARSGEVSFKRMSQIVLAELAKIAIDRIFGSESSNAVGLSSFAANLFGSRIGASSNSNLPAPDGGVAVHFHVGAGADASAILRNQGQIAAQVARAVAYGRRNL